MMRTPIVSALLALAVSTVAGAQGSVARLAVTSPDFAPNGRLPEKQVFNGMGCTGGNTSPALKWSGAPAGTKSFAVTAYDPDAPTGSGWWHWVIYNIPASATGLATDAGNATKKLAPAGSVQGNTDFGTAGFGGACPPPGHGIHHYQFTVFALKVDKIAVPANATAAMVGFNLNANALAKGTVVATYSR